MVCRLRVRVAGFAVLLGLLAGCAVNPVTGRQELALFQVSTSEEISIGQQTFPRALQQMGGEVADPQLAEYVQRVGDALAKISQRPDLPYQFKVFNDSAPNAFALPGGFVGISRGLLSALENEAQLASVLGHELGHVTARHSVQAMQRGSLLGLGTAVLGGVAGQGGYGIVTQQAGQLAAGLLENTYSREQERESDRLGVDYLVLAGYDPHGAVQLQEYFYRKVEQGAEPMWLAGLFRTHPFSKERMLELQQYVAERYASTVGSPLYVLKPQSFVRAVAGLRRLQQGYTLYDQARQFEGQGQLSKAIAVYLQAATAAPDQALILTALGTAYLKAGDLVAGQQHLNRAVQLDGQYYRSRLGMGYLLLEQEDYPRAVRELEASMALLPTLQGAYLLAGAYEGNRQLAQAVEMYRAVAKADAGGRLGQAAAERLQELERP
ncbi:MAG: M48 family metalloprotease [Desulfuromonadaceae bacterium]|nr:M48 family metalloprotease [Desulfuromonadaceae bacterium]